MTIWNHGACNNFWNILVINGTHQINKAMHENRTTIILWKYCFHWKSANIQKYGTNQQFRDCHRRTSYILTLNNSWLCVVICIHKAHKCCNSTTQTSWNLECFYQRKTKQKQYLRVKKKSPGLFQIVNIYV